MHFDKRLGEAVACDPAWRESVAKWPIKLGFKIHTYHPLGDPARRAGKNILKAGSRLPTLQGNCGSMV